MSTWFDVLGCAALASTIALGGCYSGPQDAQGATDGAGMTDGGDTDGGTDSGGVPGACDPGPGRVGLQRLTRDEYNRTVRDLFGVTDDPADVFPPDSLSGGFDNNAKSLTISPQLASLLLDTAEVVAAEAMVNRRDAIITCDPSASETCTRDILSALALRVYRRPATQAELDSLEGLVQFSADEGDTFEQSIEYALQGMLVAPQFLFRSVPASMPSGSPGDIVALDDYELATRLSYFLWGSTPDDELLARAGAGELSDPDGLREQFDRMLADSKADALYDGFVTQWLQLGKLGAATPDPTTFPEFDEQLRADMAAETELFFRDLRERDGSMLEVVTGTRTFANADLAAIYGVSGVQGSQMVEIDTDPGQRAGILTMPAILTMTSGPQHPNIVRRGVWLAETLLCAAPPPPEGGVPAEPEPVPGETERERLARHRADPNCASCHNLIDPLGFAFENYDAVGRWRDDIDGEPVDNLGSLPDGTQFNGVVELGGLLAQTDSYPTCISRKMMTYALGRAVRGAESCVVEEIGADTVTEDTSLSDLLWAVVQSEAFLTQEVSP